MESEYGILNSRRLKIMTFAASLPDAKHTVSGGGDSLWTRFLVIGYHGFRIRILIDNTHTHTGGFKRERIHKAAAGERDSKPRRKAPLGRERRT